MHQENRFLAACHFQEVDRRPIWFMRQAGRYLPEYRKIRERYQLIEICRNPELAVEVTLQPIRRFHLDAAIIFADILLPLPAMGVPFQFLPGKGPVIENPLRSKEQIRALRIGEPEDSLDFVFESLKLARSSLPTEVALVGFAGAPFTLASYMIEGGYSRHFLRTKSLMYQEPEAWAHLMETLAKMTVRYLRAQIEAGAQAVQLFDSWVGCLTPDDYRERVLPYTRIIFESLQERPVPGIHFGTGTAGILHLMKEAGGDVQSIDWRISIDSARRVLGPDTVIQGNLDPAVLFAPPEIIQREVASILRAAGNPTGHIFNLGHGILPGTPPEAVEMVVDRVREYSPTSSS